MKFKLKIKEEAKAIREKSSRMKGISFRNISQLRLCAVIIVIAVVYAFYGSGDKTLNRQFYLKSQIRKCHRDIDSLNNRIDECRKVIEQLDSDDRYLEEFAREHYYMSGRNEEVIILEKRK